MQSLYCGVLALSSLLLFSLELIVGKMLLPYFGGCPASWNACLFFFQIMLFAGYAAAHLLGRYAPAVMQQSLLLGLYGSAFLFLPVSFSAAINPGSGGIDTALTVIGELFKAIGVPFIALSMSAPLMQHWYYLRFRAKGGNPYYLYAASNTGSLVALVAYPLLIERFFGLTEQNQFWMMGIACLCVLTLSAVYSGRASGAADFGPREPVAAAQTSLTVQQRGYWLLCAAIPSALLIGVTNELSQNIAPFPLLWVIPLLLFFASYVYAFAGLGSPRFDGWRRAYVFGASLLLLSFALEMKTPIGLVAALHLAVFLLACTVCNIKLYSARPEPARLTEYYLYLALGGAAGGLFTTFFAPLIFSSFIEYPLALWLVLFICASTSFGSTAREILRQKSLRVLVLYAGAAFALLLCTGNLQNRIWLTAALAPLLLGLYRLQRRPACVAIAGFTAWAMFVALPRIRYDNKITIRNFFGLVSISKANDFNFMQHGDTVHGGEIESYRDKCFPTAYYHRGTPLGDLFERVHSSGYALKRVGVLGTGVGASVCYAEKTEAWTFFEINPAVLAFAQNETYFTFLAHNSAGEINFAVGDARMELRKQPDAYFDLLMVDVFASDAIPVHLITKEALRLYFDKLTPSGLLLFNISNRYVSLSPVLERLAGLFGRDFYIRKDFAATEFERATYKYASIWGALLPRGADLGAALRASGWELRSGADEPLWTDDYSNILPLIKWQ